MEFGLRKKNKIATGLGKAEIDELYTDFKNELHNLKDSPNKTGRVSKLNSTEIF